MPYPTAFEAQAPTVDGPVYMRTSHHGARLSIGSEFTLTLAQVDAWVAALIAAKARMKRNGSDAMKLQA